MPILFEPANLAYFSVPKCACTSLKMFFHQLDQGQTWKQSRAAGETQRLHQKYPSVPFREVSKRPLARFEKCAVVRDPVARIRSCYINKVLDNRLLHAEPAKAQAQAMNLPLDPDLDTFVARLDEYRDVCGPIKRHTQPLAFWLGRDVSYYDHLFDMTQLDQLQQIIADRLGNPDLRIPHSNRSKSEGGASNAPDMSSASKALLHARYKDDVFIFGHVFHTT